MDADGRWRGTRRFATAAEPLREAVGAPLASRLDWGTVT